MNQVEAALGRLANALRNAQVEYFKGVQRSATHGSQAALEKDLTNVSDYLQAFLNLDAFEPPGLLKRLFGAVADHEKGMLGTSLETARKAEVTAEGAIIRGSAFGFRWHQIVRTLEAMQILLALDPRLYWKKIDGDAALALVDIRSRAVEALPVLDIEWVRTHEPDAVELVRRVRRQLAEAVRQDGEWRGGAPTARSVIELGEEYPFPFDRIPNSGVGPQYHARRAAIARLNTLRRYWSDVVEDWLARGIIPKALNTRTKQKGKTNVEKMYAVRVTAGTLKMGGFHPPHQSHHDGSMFDVWPTAVGALPIFVKKGLPPSAFGVEYDPDELKLDSVENLTTTSGAGPLSPGNLGVKLEDWFFPTPEEYEKAYGYEAPRDAVKLWTRIATAFSQCIFLTFPSSTILASTIPLAAWETLRARVAEMLTSAADEDRRILGLILERLNFIRPLTWINDPEPKREKIRFGHRHHWHINYGPGLLGREGNVPSGQQAAADDIEEVISNLEGTILFRDIMGLSIEPPEEPVDQDQEGD